MLLIPRPYFLERLLLKSYSREDRQCNKVKSESLNQSTQSAIVAVNNHSLMDEIMIPLATSSLLAAEPEIAAIKKAFPHNPPFVIFTYFRTAI